MKRIFLLIVIVFFLTACKNTPEERLFNICKEIIKEPERIYNLDKYYPENYKNEYIAKGMEDIKGLKLMVNYIDSLFNRVSDTILEKQNNYFKIQTQIMNKYDFEVNGGKINNNIKDNIEIYIIIIRKEYKGDAINFIFIKEKKSYYFYGISEFKVATIDTP
jgi:hypothetical protein